MIRIYDVSRVILRDLITVLFCITKYIILLHSLVNVYMKIYIIIIYSFLLSLSVSPRPLARHCVHPFRAEIRGAHSIIPNYHIPFHFNFITSFVKGHRGNMKKLVIPLSECVLFLFNSRTYDIDAEAIRLHLPIPNYTLNPLAQNRYGAHLVIVMRGDAPRPKTTRLIAVPVNRRKRFRRWKKKQLTNKQKLNDKSSDWNVYYSRSPRRHI